MAYIPEGLVGHWAFTGQSIQRRGTIIDRSGNNHPGTVYGAPAISFDGVNDKAAATTPWDALVGHRYIWLAVRIYIDAGAATRIIYRENWAGVAAARFIAKINSTDYLQIQSRAGASGDGQRTSTSDSALTEGAWQSLLVCLDLADGTVAGGAAATAWVDGAVFAMGALSGDFTQGTYAASNPPNFQAFGLTHADGSDFAGRMNWMGLKGADTALTLTDAQQYHNNPQAWLAGNSMDAWWPCSEGTGSGTADNAEETAGHDLTLTNAGWSVAANGGNAYAQSGGTVDDSFYDGKRWFDGTDDYVTIANHADHVFGTGDFQIHVWAAIATGATDKDYIVRKGGNGANQWQLRYDNGIELNFQAHSSGVDIGGGTIVDDALHLLSVIRASGVTTMYIDTIATGTPNAGPADDLSDTSALEIGECKGDYYQVMICKKTKASTVAVAEMNAIYEAGAYV